VIKSSKGFAHLVLIIGVVLVGIFGISYLIVKDGFIPKPAPTITSTPTTSESNDTSDWKTYKNEKFGYQLSYPNDYVICHDEETSGDILHSIQLNKYFESVCEQAGLSDISIQVYDVSQKDNLINNPNLIFIVNIFILSILYRIPNYQDYQKKT
jgi:hypothetical protein